MATKILGISAFYHDSAAAIIRDHEIVAAAQEERFSRIRHDAAFPIQSVQFVLDAAGIAFSEIDAIAFYDKPLLKFERLLETYDAFVPRGLASFVASMPVWIKEKLSMRKLLREQLAKMGKEKKPIFFPEHHLSHASSAYYPSPFNEAAILTIDGVGEWATTTICEGKNDEITVRKELHFPHSVGLLYSSFTYFLGFRVNSGEYKLMGLSPYGNPAAEQTAAFKQKILSYLVDIREDGSFLLNMDYFDFATGLTMINTNKWETLFGLKQRKPESDIRQEHMNLALAIQEITEMIVIKLATTARQMTQKKNLVMAGGVALNCIANSKIQDTGLFENIWVQPAAGDAGGAIGAALAVLHLQYKKENLQVRSSDAMQGAYLGPQYSDLDILKVIKNHDAPCEHFEDFIKLTESTSQKLAAGNVVGWFQGKMEFGPRALGNRSILGDPGNPGMQKIINQKIKFRESFRPFAPSVLEEDAALFFDIDAPSPYMLFVKSLREELRKPEPADMADAPLLKRLYHLRSDIPAITHVDYSSRVQTVNKKINPRFWQLLQDFKKISGYGMLINTSFNVRGEPIVCTPEQAYQGFMRTEMDFLVLGNFLLDKRNQPKIALKKLDFSPD